MEKAYSKIRSFTGHSNISSVVQKILTKEQNYSNLMNMILENKKICDNYHQKNIELENEMHEVTANYKVPDSAIQENLKIFIRKGVKISSRNLEKLKKLKFAKSFIMQWVKNMIKKMNGESPLFCIFFNIFWLEKAAKFVVDHRTITQPRCSSTVSTFLCKRSH